MSLGPLFCPGHAPKYTFWQRHGAGLHWPVPVCLLHGLVERLVLAELALEILVQALALCHQASVLLVSPIYDPLHLIHKRVALSHAVTDLVQ